jgi:hypothetical protein
MYLTFIAGVWHSDGQVELVPNASADAFQSPDCPYVRPLRC